ncbi:MAG: class I SAM-dependent methyltransferase, partial [Chitinivibrionales bacterium]
MSPVADFGCGHGPLSILTARFGLSVTAFDCIEDNINNGNRLKTLDDRVEFVQCFLTDIPAADNSFASGVCKEVLEHIVAPEIPKVLREIQRVMRPGAVVIFTVPRETILRSIAPLEHVTFFESPTRLATYLKA